MKERLLQDILELGHFKYSLMTFGYYLVHKYVENVLHMRQDSHDNI